MYEPEFFNNTLFSAAPFPILNAQGNDCRVVIVKATYKLNENEELTDEPSEIRLGDEMWGAPEIPDIKYPGDLCCYKPGTDVVLVGHACGSASRPASSVVVNISVGNINESLRIYGERYWDTWGLGHAITPAAFVERVPLAWSLAWGGFDNSNPDSPVEDSRNPVGRGVARNPKDLAGTLAPQIESVSAPITGWGKGNVPAGCAPLGRHFEPRRTWAGTYDGNWLQNVYPAKPADYDVRHENCASPSLTLSTPLVSGEVARIVGLQPGREIHFAIPHVRLKIEATIDGQRIEQIPHLDTLLIDADRDVAELVWRAAFECPAKMRNRFTEIQLSSKEVI